jgi:hypothetical protein
VFYVVSTNSPTIRQSNVVRALARWLHIVIVALHETTNALHWAMHIAPYCRIRTEVEIASDSLHFLLSSILLLPTTIS